MTEPTVTPNRTCTKCGFEGLPGEFHRHFSICRPCNKEVRKANLAAAQRERRNRSEASKEKARMACRNWKIKYPERYKAAQKKWYDKNSEKKSTYSREYSKRRRAADPAWKALTNNRSTERCKRLWRTDPSYRRRQMDWTYRYNYGLNLEDVEAMSEAQNGCCALCQRKKKLTVDHDHHTGKVRELLCHGCNQGLGQFGDSITRLQDAVDYLRRHAPT